MPSEYVKKADLVPFDSNPFVRGLVYPKQGGSQLAVKYKTAKVGGEASGWVSRRCNLVDKETGELIDDMVTLNRKIRVDSEAFVKVYEAGIAQIFGLSPRAQEVLRYLLKAYNDEQLSGSNDHLYFSFEDCQRNGYKRKRQTWRSAMNELMYQEFMVESTRGVNWYYINPTLFYRGDRLVMINQFVKDETARVGGKSPVQIEEEVGDPELDQYSLLDGMTERQRRAMAADPALAPPKEAL